MRTLLAMFPPLSQGTRRQARPLGRTLGSETSRPPSRDGGGRGPGSTWQEQHSHPPLCPSGAPIRPRPNGPARIEPIRGPSAYAAANPTPRHRAVSRRSHAAVFVPLPPPGLAPAPNFEYTAAGRYPARSFRAAHRGPGAGGAGWAPPTRGPARQAAMGSRLRAGPGSGGPRRRSMRSNVLLASNRGTASPPCAQRLRLRGGLSERRTHADARPARTGPQWRERGRPFPKHQM